MNKSNHIADNEIVISISETDDNFGAQLAVKKVAAEIGFDETNQALAATVVSELSTNILRYAGSGEIRIRKVRKENLPGMEIIAEDNGPGIKNLDLAMEDNFTTTKNSLGLGLASVKRIMDEFYINSTHGKGTYIKTIKWSTNNAG